MNPHGHDHAPAPDAGEAMPSYYEVMETSVRELLVEKQLIGADEIRRMLEVMELPHPGAGRQSSGTGLG